MRIKEVYDSLLSDGSGLQGYLKKIPHKNKRTEKAQVESLTKLAYVFFLKDEGELCEKIIDLLSCVPFENDYDYWTWLEFSLSLRAYLNHSGEKGIESLDKINSALNYGDGLPKKIRLNVHARFLSGEGVVLELTENCSQSDEFDIRLVYLMKAIKLFILNGNLSGTDLKLSIESNIKRLRDLLDNMDFFSTTPFH